MEGFKETKMANYSFLTQCNDSSSKSNENAKKQNPKEEDKEEHLGTNQENEKEADYYEEEIIIPDIHLPLPLHVAFKVFTLMPIPCIARLRLVCSSWKALLSSPSFLASLHQVELVDEAAEIPQKPAMYVKNMSICSTTTTSPQPTRINNLAPEWWFVMAAKRLTGSALATTTKMKPSPSELAMVAFSPRVGPWDAFRLPAGFDILQLSIASSQSTVPSVVNMLVASAGGLICAVVKSPKNTKPTRTAAVAPQPGISCLHDIVVFNCLTGASRRLPRPDRLVNGLISSCAISMSPTWMSPINRKSVKSTEPAAKMNKNGRGYRIILSDLKYRDMEVFDSRTGAWTVGRGIRNCDFRCSEEVSMADLLQSDLIIYRKQTEIAAYDAGTNTWKKVEVPLPKLSDTELLHSTIAKCKGRLLLVACLINSSSSSMQGFGIWQLIPSCTPMSRFTWSLVGRTPAHILVSAFAHTRFDSPAFFDCHVVANARSDSLCMTGAHHMISCPHGTQFWPPLVYNLARDEWHLLPPSKHLTEFLCLFHFEPNYNALV